MTAVSASEARATLPELLTRVEEGEEVTITRHGRVVAVLVHPSALRSRRAERALAEADRIHEILAEARSRSLIDAVGVSADRAEELVTELRAGRRER